MKNRIVFTMSIGVILQWLSLFFSYSELPNAYQDINNHIATGGFPLKIFEYPVPLMGSDWPPTNTWPTFFLNFAIWLAVGLLISILLDKKLENKRLIKSLGILAILLSVIGIFYIMLKFD